MDSTYLVTAAILIAVVLAAVWLEKWSVPVILVALGAGILFGSDVLAWWDFNDIALVNQVANLALIYILFFGGFSTCRTSLRKVALVSGGLATWGVVLTAAITYAVLRWIFYWDFEIALLVAVIVSSTDAAAIFSILRHQPLSRRLSATVEIESAANDPMAIVLTVAVIEALTVGDAPISRLFGTFIWQFLAAPVVGWLLGQLALWLYNHLGAQERGQYYVLTLGLVLLVYGTAELVGASGMLAVFVAGYVIGNQPFVHKQGVANFISAVSTIANIGLFVLLGLQVFPKEWVGIWKQGVILFLVLSFVARPLAVWLGTIGMKIGAKEKNFIAWAGLRGSVPIVLATYPMAANLPSGHDIFNLVFFVVLLSIGIQGATLGVVGRWLGFTVEARPQALFNLELFTLAASDLEMLVVDLPGQPQIKGAKIRDLTLPEGTVITLITRDKDLVIPRGNTRLQGWDQVSVLTHANDVPLVKKALRDAMPEEARNEIVES